MPYVTLGAEPTSKLDVLKKEATEAVMAANNIFTGFLRSNVETMKLEQARPDLIKYLTPIISFATKTNSKDVKKVLENTTVERTTAGGYVIRVPDKPHVARQRALFLLIRNTFFLIGAVRVLTNVFMRGKRALVGNIGGRAEGRPLYLKLFKITLRAASGRRFTTTIQAFDEDTAKRAVLARVIAKFGGDVMRKGVYVERVEKKHLTNQNF